MRDNELRCTNCGSQGNPVQVYDGRTLVLFVTGGRPPGPWCVECWQKLVQVKR